MIKHKYGGIHFPNMQAYTTNSDKSHSNAASTDVQDLINALLHPEPSQRPAAEDIKTTFKWFH